MGSTVCAGRHGQIVVDRADVVCSRGVRSLARGCGRFFLIQGMVVVMAPLPDGNPGPQVPWQDPGVASRPLLSGVSVEKDEDEFGEKGSALPQANIYCAMTLYIMRVQRAESSTAFGVRKHAAFERMPLAG